MSDIELTSAHPKFFEQRRHNTSVPRPGDVRTPYQRDRARLLHSSAFRRLQGKTQVMGVGEGDFHRTRLTHSIECAQIGSGLLEHLTIQEVPPALRDWIPSRDLVEAACFAHDLGHPPFGHSGEKALDQAVRGCGGFEGNGQTLRIITKLEKYQTPGWGIDPTRRLVLSVLKYPIPYSRFDLSKHSMKPPKCFMDTESDVVDWALEGFSTGDRDRLLERSQDTKDKPIHRSFDCGLMELADDIAYGIHDIEDIVARHLATKEEVDDKVSAAFSEIGGQLQSHGENLTSADVINGLFESSYKRKQTVARLVNVFISNVRAERCEGFQHPLLEFRAVLPDEHRRLLALLKDIALKLVVSKAQVQQLEKRGRWIIEQLFVTLKDDPTNLIPKQSWNDGDHAATNDRRVCDYIAGMTDSYAEKVYRRLFVPGWGSSTDEL